MAENDRLILDWNQRYLVSGDRRLQFCKVVISGGREVGAQRGDKTIKLADSGLYKEQWKLKRWLQNGEKRRA